MRPKALLAALGALALAGNLAAYSATLAGLGLRGGEELNPFTAALLGSPLAPAATLALLCAALALCYWVYAAGGRWEACVLASALAGYQLVDAAHDVYWLLASGFTTQYLSLLWLAAAGPPLLVAALLCAEARA